jgi:hypothetical protein
LANRLLTELSQAPLPEMLQRLGLAIAETQYALDRNAIALAELMGDRETHGVQFSGEEQKRSLLELGFTPTFYHIGEATIDVRVALSMAQSTETSVAFSATVGVTAYFVMVAATVSASYTNKYSYEASGSSALTARFTAIPPPTPFLNFLSTRVNAPVNSEEPQ